MIELLDDYTITIDGDDYSDKVVKLEVNGSTVDPDGVTVRLGNGVSFDIPWRQYERTVNDE